MKNLREIFYFDITEDRLTAHLCYNIENMDKLKDLSISEANITEFLKENKITYGVKYDQIKELVQHLSPEQFPIVIAEGTEKIDGEDGQIIYESDMSTEVDRSEGWDFREVMKIPTVQKGDTLARIIPPTEGKDGRTVFNTVIQAKRGEPVKIRAGQNVIYDEKDLTFYATSDGQVSVSANRINIHSLYEVREDISLKVGNIDFIGSVHIHGDVPSGFTIKAVGDIKIFGLVEAAKIEAGGSVFISEGIAGLKTGKIEAGENVYIGYVNQGRITAGNSIVVDNSILHSDCTAMNDIVCQRGNVIGGVLSAGRTIKVNNAGNRMNSDTILSFDRGKKLEQELQKLESEKKTMEENIKKIRFLMNKIENSLKGNEDAKTRATLIKLKSSHKKSSEQLESIKDRLFQINHNLGETQQSYVQVKGTIYPNVTIGFGKYKRKITSEYHHVLIKLNKNEIDIINQ